MFIFRIYDIQNGIRLLNRPGMLQLPISRLNHMICMQVFPLFSFLCIHIFIVYIALSIWLITYTYHYALHRGNSKYFIMIGREDGALKIWDMVSVMDPNITNEEIFPIATCYMVYQIHSKILVFSYLLYYYI